MENFLSWYYTSNLIWKNDDLNWTEYYNVVFFFKFCNFGKMKYIKLNFKNKAFYCFYCMNALLNVSKLQSLNLFFSVCIFLNTLIWSLCENVNRYFLIDSIFQWTILIEHFKTLWIGFWVAAIAYYIVIFKYIVIFTVFLYM